MFLFSPKLFCLALSLAVGGVVGAPVAQGSVNTLNGGRPRPVWVGRATVDHKNDGWAIPRVRLRSAAGCYYLPNLNQDGDEMRSVNSWNGGTARPVWVKRAAVDVKNDGWAIPREEKAHSVNVSVA
ncbi:hypothetical protein C8R43DRAFT_1034021 [Mycena crocata]|nr:hypothetical protein C8R43DRAFT_1034021 [Mycena crocata]